MTASRVQDSQTSDPIVANTTSTGATGRTDSPPTTTAALDLRRSIFPMRYPSSEESFRELPLDKDSDDNLTASPQSATLFPSGSYLSSSRLPPHPSPLLALRKEDMDVGYTHSFYDLKATARTTRTIDSPAQPHPKAFWENLIRLLPWVQDKVQDTTVIDTTVNSILPEDYFNKIRSANRIVSRTGQGSSTDSTQEDDVETSSAHDLSDKNHQRAATIRSKRPSSILRRSRFSSEQLVAGPPPPEQQQQALSEENPASAEFSDTPSLAPDSDSSIASSTSSVSQHGLSSLLTEAPPKPARRCISEPFALSKRPSFDPRISVRQFNRSQEELKNTWFSQDELSNFRKEALQRIIQYQRRGTNITPGGGRAIFTHQALGLSHDSIETNIQNILIVDAHDICANLFAKGLLAIFPHARIVKARSTGEATQQMQQTRFDVILVEERLKMFHRQIEPASGSCLLKSVSHQSQTLLVGVSAHLAEDAPKLQAAGADVLWSKPPPRMDDDLRKSLINALQAKRNKHAVASARPALSV